MYPYLLLIQVLSLIIGFFVIITLFFHKPFRGQLIFILLSATMTVQCFGYFQELTSTSLDSVIVAIKTQYLGSCFVNLLFLYFLLDYCNYKKSKALFGFLFILNVIILIAVLTCEYHNIYYTSMEFVQDGIFPHVVLGKGPLYQVFKTEVLIMNIVVVITLLKHYFSLNRSKRRQEIYFILACLSSSITCLLYAFGLFDDYDPSSSSFVVSGALILLAIYRHQIFDVIHTARDSVIETMDEALIVTDSLFHLLHHNPAAEKLFPELKQCKQNVQLKDISSFLDELFQKEMLLEFETNGCYYRSQITKIYQEQNLVGYYAWVFDVTQSRNLIENQIQLREQAENANKAKSLFLANMSHEIRTPLNTILGLADIILNQDINYQVRSDIINIKTAGKTLLNIINDILDLSRIESGKMRLVNEEYKLTTVLHDVIGIVRVKLTQKPIILKVDVEKNLPKYLIGDELRLRQLLINILNNAVKFTNQGSICFSIKASYPDPLRPNDIVLQIQIKDTGRGIAPEDQKRIFEMFEQVDLNPAHPIEGSGLGLSICNRLLSMIGGSIVVDSELGKGSTFTITIPQEISEINHEVKTSDFSGLESNPNLVPNHSSHSYTALVVDDNPMNLLVAKRLLAIFKLEVTTLETGQEAIDILNHNSFDIIFLDYMMPDMDGIETLHAIRELSPPYCKTVPIIALTANAVNGVDKILLNEGFQDYISKPIELSEMGELLTKWLSIDTYHVTISDNKQLNNIQSDAFQQFSKFYSIDWKKGLTNCANQWNSYFETLAVFSSDGIRQLEQLNQAFDANDLSLYSVWVHAIKSSLLTIGANAMAEQAMMLEFEAKENHDAYLQENHHDFLNKCQILCHAISGFLSSN